MDELAEMTRHPVLWPVLMVLGAAAVIVATLACIAVLVAWAVAYLIEGCRWAWAWSYPGRHHQRG